MRPLRHAFFAIGLLSLASLASGVDHNHEPPPAPQDLRVIADQPYVNHASPSQRLDLYLPAETKGDRPLIVLIHGGAWLEGDKRSIPRDAIAQVVRHGYAVASINYRLSREAVFPAQIEDCKAAVRWLRAHATEYGLDSHHVGVWGDSAGGHLVALLGTTAGVKSLEGDEGNPNVSDRVQAVCDWYGPSDLLSIFKQAGAKALFRPDDPDSPISRLLGGPLPKTAPAAKAASPVSYVSKDAAPFLIMHGDKDPLVPLAQSEELRDKLKKAGVKVELDVIRGAGHGFPGHPELLGKILTFFDKHLKPAA